MRTVNVSVILSMYIANISSYFTFILSISRQFISAPFCQLTTHAFWIPSAFSYCFPKNTTKFSWYPHNPSFSRRFIYPSYIGDLVSFSNNSNICHYEVCFLANLPGIVFGFLLHFRKVGFTSHAETSLTMPRITPLSVSVISTTFANLPCMLFAFLHVL